MSYHYPVGGQQPSYVPKIPEKKPQVITNKQQEVKTTTISYNDAVKKINEISKKDGIESKLVPLGKSVVSSVNSVMTNLNTLKGLKKEITQCQEAIKEHDAKQKGIEKFGVGVSRILSPETALPSKADAAMTNIKNLIKGMKGSNEYKLSQEKTKIDELKKKESEIKKEIQGLKQERSKVEGQIKGRTTTTFGQMKELASSKLGALNKDLKTYDNLLNEAEEARVNNSAQIQSHTEKLEQLNRTLISAISKESTEPEITIPMSQIAMGFAVIHEDYKKPTVEPSGVNPYTFVQRPLPPTPKPLPTVVKPTKGVTFTENYTHLNEALKEVASHFKLALQENWTYSADQKINEVMYAVHIPREKSKFPNFSIYIPREENKSLLIYDSNTNKLYEPLDKRGDNWKVQPVTVEAKKVEGKQPQAALNKQMSRVQKSWMEDKLANEGLWIQGEDWIVKAAEYSPYSTHEGSKFYNYVYFDSKVAGNLPLIYDYSNEKYYKPDNNGNWIDQRIKEGEAKVKAMKETVEEMPVIKLEVEEKPPTLPPSTKLDIVQRFWENNRNKWHLTEDQDNFQSYTTDKLPGIYYYRSKDAFENPDMIYDQKSDTFYTWDGELMSWVIKDLDVEEG